MSHDLSIRPMTPREQGRAAAFRTASTQQIESNPHALGTDAHMVWQGAYETYLLLATAPEESEARA